MEVIPLGGLAFEAIFPFTMDLYQTNINDFFQFFVSHKGFGVTNSGVTVVEEVLRQFQRSLLLIIPSFLISLFLGTLLGIIQFMNQHKRKGKIQENIIWFFSSVPDFFLYMAIQFGLIKIMNAGFPRFSLYGNDQWYNFIIPCIAITIFPLIHFSKATTASMEREAGQDYVRTSIGKGMENKRVMIHMFWNCLNGLINQCQFIMLYIVSSLPIIEKLSNYHGAGYHLLDSILKLDTITSFAFIIPFLLLMFVTVLLSQAIKIWILPKKGEGAH